MKLQVAPSFFSRFALHCRKGELFGYMSETLRAEYAALMDQAIAQVGNNADLLRVLIKVGTNILNEPHDDRKRKLRAGNSKVITSVLEPRGGIVTLQALGFIGRDTSKQGGSGFFVLPQDAPLSVVGDGVKSLHNALAALHTPEEVPQQQPEMEVLPSTDVVITYNCTAGYSCDLANIKQGILTAQQYMSPFPCCVYIFGTCDGKYTDTDQLAGYNRAKGFPCPGPLAVACTNADNTDNISQVRALVRTGEIPDWMAEDYSSPPSLVQRIQRGEMDIYASNTDGPPGSRSMLVLCNPHKMQAGELEGRMIHEYTHVFQEFSIAPMMRKHRRRCDGDQCDVNGERLPIW
jgi:hypothetical protein